jgi:hypothetical protein
MHDLGRLAPNATFRSLPGLKIPIRPRIQQFEGLAIPVEVAYNRLEDKAGELLAKSGETKQTHETKGPPAHLPPRHRITISEMLSSTILQSTILQSTIRQSTILQSTIRQATTALFWIHPPCARSLRGVCG